MGSDDGSRSAYGRFRSLLGVARVDHHHQLSSDIFERLHVQFAGDVQHFGDVRRLP